VVLIGSRGGQWFEALQQQGANGKQRLSICSGADGAGLKERIQMKTAMKGNENRLLEAYCQSNIL
jgi:hypothetical protein